MRNLSFIINRMTRNNYWNGRYYTARPHVPTLNCQMETISLLTHYWLPSQEFTLPAEAESALDKMFGVKQ